jgi:hypothetical protein
MCRRRPDPPLWDPTHVELEACAELHITYEVSRLVRQARELGSWTTEKNHVWDALLEACLVHIRVLDDFLRKPRFSDDVVAANYTQAMVTGFLKKPEPKDINGHVHHLTSRRRPFTNWEIQELATRCCTAFEEFVAALPPERQAWFGGCLRLSTPFLAGEELPP